MMQLISGVSGITPWPSDGNYLLCEFDENEAIRVFKELASKGIFVRNFKSDRLKNFFRIAVGKPGETDLLVNALKQIM